jgi:hypothetical protein
MSEFRQFMTEDARLVILKTLHGEVSNTLNEVLLLRALETFGHYQTREFVRTQIRALAGLGAVTVTEAGTVLIARITRFGIDHVERRAVIDGVRRPSPES